MMGSLEQLHEATPMMPPSSMVKRAQRSRGQRTQPSSYAPFRRSARALPKCEHGFFSL
jgi:hypothetical protein